MKRLLALSIVTLLFIPNSIHAADSAFEDTVVRAEVVEVRSSGERALPATRTTTEYQELSVRIIEGELNGKIVDAENTTTVTLQPGDVFYLHKAEGIDGAIVWAVGEPDRVWVLFALLAVFILVTVVVGGMAGVRALVSLVGSFALIIFGLVPALFAGAPPVLTCTLLAIVMLVFSMLVTHGYNRTTLTALLAGIAALAMSVVVAEGAVVLAKLSGFASDEVVFLNFASGGVLDLTGLLLGGILIGIVGVLNDISVSQLHTIAEIHSANPTLSRREVFVRAVRVGREHLGAVVNTLPLAYAGSALPLLMLFSASTAPLLFIINREVFAAEIIRILAGGIALALSGAIATTLGVLLLVRRKKAL